MAKKYLKYLSYPIGLVIALIVFSITLLIMQFNPVDALIAIPTGAFGTVTSASETLLRFIPLLLTALAFLIALKARFLNLGVEGQLYMGALLAYLVGSKLESFPSWLSLPIIILAGFIGGVLWLAIPLILKTKLGVNEIFPTIVMNFIASYIISWLVTGPLKDPYSTHPRTPFVPESTQFPVFQPPYRIHFGIILVILIAIVLYLLLNKTTLGYKIRAVGQNPKASLHGGVNVTWSIISAGLLSGGIAGLVGAMEVFGVHHNLSSGFSPGFGYVGIGVAALGNFHPLGSILSAFFFAILQIGGESMQRGAGIPVDIITIMQAVMVLTILVVQNYMTRREKL